MGRHRTHPPNGPMNEPAPKPRRSRSDQASHQFGPRASDSALPECLQAITFDVGGTLLEPWPSVGHVYAEVAARHGLPGLAPEALNRQFHAAWRALPEFHYTRAEWA